MGPGGGAVVVGRGGPCGGGWFAQEVVPEGDTFLGEPLGRLPVRDVVVLGLQSSAASTHRALRAK